MPALRIDDLKLVFPEGKVPGWHKTDWGMDDGHGGNKFGRVVHVAVCDEQGNFQFDKPVIQEGPHSITLTHGHDPKTGKLKLALVRERRDTAAKLDGVDAPEFWGPPRGYAEQTDNGLIAAARREAGEETGARVLTGEPWIVALHTVPNETIVRSTSPWVAIPVDLTKIGKIKADRNEKIFKAQFFTLEEIHQMILAGEHEGASTQSWCLAAAALYFQLHVVPVAAKMAATR